MTLLPSIVATFKSNENDRFSAQLGLLTLISGTEIDVGFCSDNRIFEEEKKHLAFLLLQRPTYIKHVTVVQILFFKPY